MQEIKRNQSGVSHNIVLKNSQINQIGSKTDSITNNKKSTDSLSTERSREIENFLQRAESLPEEKFAFDLPRLKAKFNLNFLSPLAKKILIGAAILLLLLVIILFAVSRGKTAVSGSGWYAIKLVNGEMYFGQIADEKADPLAVKNVYYNYQGKDETDQSSNLRLVKRGKESYGPSGEMLVVRSQVVYIEPLKKSSKVLEAILEYEK